MMSLESAVIDKLNASASLLAVLTGGVYGFEGSAGRNGISPESAPDAYDEGFLKPTAVVRQRSKVPFGGGVDVQQQTETMRGVVEVYLYDEGDQGNSALESAYALVNGLLNQRFVAGAGRMKRIGLFLGLRDPDMSNALYHRADYQIVYIER